MTPGVRHSGIVNWLIYLFIYLPNHTLHAALFLADFNFTKSFLFYPKIAPKSLAAGASPQTPLKGLTAIQRLVEGRGGVGIFSKPELLAKPMHDVIDFKCTKNFLFELKMHHYRWQLVLHPQTLLGPYNDLQTVGRKMIRNRNFDQNQLAGYAAIAVYGRF